MGFIFSPKASDGLTTTCQLLMTLLSTIKNPIKLFAVFPETAGNLVVKFHNEIPIGC